jgi:hypothetical protein
VLCIAQPPDLDAGLWCIGQVSFTPCTHVQTPVSSPAVANAIPVTAHDASWHNNQMMLTARTSGRMGGIDAAV